MIKRKGKRKEIKKRRREKQETAYLEYRKIALRFLKESGYYIIWRNFVFETIPFALKNQRLIAIQQALYTDFENKWYRKQTIKLLFTEIPYLNRLFISYLDKNYSEGTWEPWRPTDEQFKQIIIRSLRE